MKKIKLAVYGGAFNPPHAGHTSVIKRLLDQADIILIVPSFAHPFGKSMAPFNTRIEWLKKLVDSAKLSSRVIISDVEEIMVKNGIVNGPIYSIDLLRHLHKSYGCASKEIALVMGEDNAKVFPSFYGYQDIIDNFSVIVLEETMQLHSTMIRQHLSEHNTIPAEWMIEGLDIADYRSLLIPAQTA
jgi:nicotinate-nucleotide adenylyltransferase